jgi:hypothetical protein
VGIAGRGRGIVPSESGVGLGVRLSIGAGVGSDRTVSGVRSGDACAAAVGSGTLVDTGNRPFGWASADTTAITPHKESRLALRVFIGA